jgi:pilus assembly protein TadC
MLESYAESAGPELKHELTITVADMKSGNYEDAIIRLESRVGSSMMSDVCRGLIGILRGDDNKIYWASLALKFNDTARQQLRLQAQKVPKKVKRLSMCLLICFMLIYVVVILEQIMGSIGVLFG